VAPELPSSGLKRHRGRSDEAIRVEAGLPDRFVAAFWEMTALAIRSDRKLPMREVRR
jgi:hypothetical protein